MCADMRADMCIGMPIPLNGYASGRVYGHAHKHVRRYMYIKGHFFYRLVLAQERKVLEDHHQSVLETHWEPAQRQASMRLADGESAADSRSSMPHFAARD